MVPEQITTLLPYSEPAPTGVRLLATLLRNPIEAWAREHFEEPVVDVNSPFGRRLIVSRPDLIRHILVDNAANYTRDPLQKRVLSRTTGCGIFMSSGEEWRRQRRAMAPFFSPSALRMYRPQMRQGSGQLVSRLTAQDGKPVAIHREMMAVAVDNLIGSLFPQGLAGGSVETAIEDIRNFSVAMAAVRPSDLFNLPDWIPGPSKLAGMAIARKIRERSRRMVSSAQQVPFPQASTTIIGELLKHLRTPERPDGLSLRQIEDNVSTLLGAGSDTTASALTWALLLLAGAPEARSKVEEEALAFAGSSYGPDDLPWTRAVIEETMRLFPPAPVIGRMALADDVCAEVSIRQGTEIFIAPWVVHRHRTLWREPDTFRPERFLRESRESIPRFAYLPFGAGPRICIGAQFAMQEMVYALSGLCASLRIDRITEEPLKLQQHITLQPAGRFQMMVRKI